ncbi:enediyne biosynthesis protein UnbU [Amycolatopsis sp. NPDC026612]|uniref:enediyne biosynthesis protein UnbU n=1 Tax=Amycolatopsis sp. NPDC026612 TaxID=3155466 RepID=UPI0033DFF783
MSTRRHKPKDPRSAALRRFGLSITVLTVVGHTLLGFEQAYLTPVTAVLVALSTELFLETLDALAQRRRPRYRASAGEVVDFLLPAYIGGLACAMLLYANSELMPTVLAVVIAVASKYLVRVRVKGRLRHVLNPSNTGIVAVLLLFPWVSIAPPYQFTEWTGGFVDGLIPLLLLGAGTMLNGKLTKKLPLIAGWVGGFLVQAVARAAITDISLVSALLPVTGTAFILFTNYMITDPSTSPSKPRNQALFGLATAATYGLLVQFHVVFGLFFALVGVCALRGAFLAVQSWLPKTANEPVALAVPSTVPVPSIPEQTSSAEDAGLAASVGSERV